MSKSKLHKKGLRKASLRIKSLVDFLEGQKGIQEKTHNKSGLTSDLDLRCDLDCAFNQAIALKEVIDDIIESLESQDYE